MTSPILTEIMDAVPTLTDSEAAEIQELAHTLFQCCGAEHLTSVLYVPPHLNAPLAIVITAGLAVLEK